MQGGPSTDSMQADDDDAGLLRGAFDIHVHACPHINRRRVNALEAARQALAAGMRGLVLIDNFANSSGIAGLVEELLPGGADFRVLGGVVLNHQVGLINPAAVDAAIQYGNGAAFVSLPTHHTRRVALEEGRSREEVERALAIPGKMDAPLAQVLDIVAEHDVVLNTGHIAADEALRVVAEARRRGVNRVVVPAYGYGSEALKELAAMGAFLEFSFFFLTHAAHVPATHIDRLKTTSPAYTPVDFTVGIRTAGVERCIMSSDAGSWVLPPPVEALREFVATMLVFGFSSEEVRTMVATNPLHLFSRWVEAN